MRRLRARHCREFYSVAEHSVRVSLAVPPELALLGLLHDASEAYLVDLPRPVKRHMRDYGPAEDAVMEAICERFGLRWTDNYTAWQQVKEADGVLLTTEARDLMGKSLWPWETMPEPLTERIVPWSQPAARARFLLRFFELAAMP